MRLDIFFLSPPCVSSRLWSLPICATRAKFSRHCRADSGSLSFSESPCRFLFFFWLQARVVLVWYSPHYPHLLLSFHTVCAVWGGWFSFLRRKNSKLPYHPEIPPRFGSWESGVSRGWMRGPTTHAGNPLGSSRVIALHRMLVFHCGVPLQASGMGEPRDNGSSSDIALR